MKSLYSNRNESKYFEDQPELVSTLKEWLLSLNLDLDVGDSGTLETIECHSRDGFIRASHNFGGFDFYHMTDVNQCNGSGQGPNLKEIDRQVEQAYTKAVQWFKKQSFIGLEHLADAEITYSKLYDLGRGDLAEKLSEVEAEWMESPVWWGLRAMYEGLDTQGVHTIVLHASGNVSEYYGAFGKGSESLAEFEIRFKTISGLKRQLSRLKTKVESAF